MNLSVSSHFKMNKVRLTGKATWKLYVNHNPKQYTKRKLAFSTLSYWSARAILTY